MSASSQLSPLAGSASSVVSPTQVANRRSSSGGAGSPGPLLESNQSSSGPHHPTGRTTAVVDIPSKDAAHRRGSAPQLAPATTSTATTSCVARQQQPPPPPEAQQQMSIWHRRHSQQDGNVGGSSTDASRGPSYEGGRLRSPSGPLLDTLEQELASGAPPMATATASPSPSLEYSQQRSQPQPSQPLARSAAPPTTPSPPAPRDNSGVRRRGSAGRAGRAGGTNASKATTPRSSSSRSSTSGGRRGRPCAEGCSLPPMPPSSRPTSSTTPSECSATTPVNRSTAGASCAYANTVDNTTSRMAPQTWPTSASLPCTPRRGSLTSLVPSPPPTATDHSGPSPGDSASLPTAPVPAPHAHAVHQLYKSVAGAKPREALPLIIDQLKSQQGAQPKQRRTTGATTTTTTSSTARTPPAPRSQSQTKRRATPPTGAPSNPSSNSNSRSNSSHNASAPRQRHSSSHAPAPSLAPFKPASTSAPARPQRTPQRTSSVPARGGAEISNSPPGAATATPRGLAPPSVVTSLGTDAAHSNANFGEDSILSSLPAMAGAPLAFSGSVHGTHSINMGSANPHLPLPESGSGGGGGDGSQGKPQGSSSAATVLLSAGASPASLSLPGGSLGNSVTGYSVAACSNSHNNTVSGGQASLGIMYPSAFAPRSGRASPQATPHTRNGLNPIFTTTNTINNTMNSCQTLLLDETSRSDVSSSMFSINSVDLQEFMYEFRMAKEAVVSGDAAAVDGHEDREGEAARLSRKGSSGTSDTDADAEDGADGVAHGMTTAADGSSLRSSDGEAVRESHRRDSKRSGAAAAAAAARRRSSSRARRDEITIGELALIADRVAFPVLDMALLSDLFDELSGVTSRDVCTSVRSSGSTINAVLSHNAALQGGGGSNSSTVTSSAFFSPTVRNSLVAAAMSRSASNVRLSSQHVTPGTPSLLSTTPTSHTLHAAAHMPPPPPPPPPSWKGGAAGGTLSGSHASTTPVLRTHGMSATRNSFEEAAEALPRSAHGEPTVDFEAFLARMAFKIQGRYPTEVIRSAFLRTVDHRAGAAGESHGMETFPSASSVRTTATSVSDAWANRTTRQGGLCRTAEHDGDDTLEKSAHTPRHRHRGRHGDALHGSEGSNSSSSGASPPPGRSYASGPADLSDVPTCAPTPTHAAQIPTNRLSPTSTSDHQQHPLRSGTSTTRDASGKSSGTRGSGPCESLSTTTPLSTPCDLAHTNELPATVQLLRRPRRSANREEGEVEGEEEGVEAHSSATAGLPRRTLPTGASTDSLADAAGLMGSGSHPRAHIPLAATRTTRQHDGSLLASPSTTSTATPRSDEASVTNLFTTAAPEATEARMDWGVGHGGTTELPAATGAAAPSTTALLDTVPLRDCLTHGIQHFLGFRDFNGADAQQALRRAGLPDTNLSISLHLNDFIRLVHALTAVVYGTVMPGGVSGTASVVGGSPALSTVNPATAASSFGVLASPQQPDSGALATFSLAASHRTTM